MPDIDQEDEGARSARQRWFPRMDGGASIIIGGILLGIATKVYRDRKRREWMQDIANNKCPWNNKHTISYTDGDDWECAVKPKRHNSKRFWSYFLD
jgi:hypothetical protein